MHIEQFVGKRPPEAQSWQTYPPRPKVGQSGWLMKLYYLDSYEGTNLNMIFIKSRGSNLLRAVTFTIVSEILDGVIGIFIIIVMVVVSFKEGGVFLQILTA